MAACQGCPVASVPQVRRQGPSCGAFLRPSCEALQKLLPLELLRLPLLLLLLWPLLPLL